jgi:hypothetical protein
MKPIARYVLGTGIVNNRGHELTENHGIIGYGNMGKPFAKTPWV